MQGMDEVDSEVFFSLSHYTRIRGHQLKLNVRKVRESLHDSGYNSIHTYMGVSHVDCKGTSQ